MPPKEMNMSLLCCCKQIFLKGGARSFVFGTSLTFVTPHRLSKCSPCVILFFDESFARHQQRPVRVNLILGALI